MTDWKKKEEAKKIKNPKDAADFILRHHLDLTKLNSEAKPHIRENLESIFKMLPEFTHVKKEKILKYDVSVNGRMTRSYSKKEFLSRIEVLENIKRKVVKWREFPVQKETNHFITAADELIKAYKESIPPPKRGGKDDMRNLFFRDILIGLWTVILGHKNFFYGGNRTEDSADELIHDIVLANYRGKEVTEIHGLQEVLQKASDKRPSRKRKEKTWG